MFAPSWGERSISPTMAVSSPSYSSVGTTRECHRRHENDDGYHEVAARLKAKTAITAKAKPERRHASRSPTPCGLMASGRRLNQGSASYGRGGAVLLEVRADLSKPPAPFLAHERCTSARSVSKTDVPVRRKAVHIAPGVVIGRQFRMTEVGPKPDLRLRGSECQERTFSHPASST